MFFKPNKEDPEDVELQNLFGSAKIVLEPDANMRSFATSGIKFVTAFLDAGFTREEAFEMYKLTYLEALR